MRWCKRKACGNLQVTMKQMGMLLLRVSSGFHEKNIYWLLPCARFPSRGSNRPERPSPILSEAPAKASRWWERVTSRALGHQHQGARQSVGGRACAPTTRQALRRLGGLRRARQWAGRHRGEGIPGWRKPKRRRAEMPAKYFSVLRSKATWEQP